MDAHLFCYDRHADDDSHARSDKGGTANGVALKRNDNVAVLAIKLKQTTVLHRSK
jgi:hypothetical protein